MIKTMTNAQSSFKDSCVSSNCVNKVSIVGGGVIGLSIAWELSKRGHRVRLLEREPQATPERVPVRNTSWTACGILPPANFERATDPLERLRGFSHSLWPTWGEQLRNETGIDSGLVRCGGYYLAETAGEAAVMVGMVDYWNELEIQCEAINPQRLTREQPRLVNWVKNSRWVLDHPESAAWWVPDEWQLRPPRLLRSLHASCVERGVDFEFGSAVTEQTLQQLRHDSDAVVLCGGVSTGLIAEDLHLSRSLVPVRGQMLLLQCDEFDQPTVVNVGNRYLVARGDGSVLVGSCEEEVGMDQRTTEEMILSLREFAGGVSPLLSNAPEQARWAGLRPMTFDGFPIIGRVPGQENLFVAAGHYRSGIHFAPATAVAIADGIEERETFMDIRPFSVGHQQEHSS